MKATFKGASIRFYQLRCSYSECCFCERPALPPNSGKFAFDPRFEFKKNATSYAAEHGLTALQFGKYKSALAVLPVACSHRQAQTVRIEWALYLK